MDERPLRNRYDFEASNMPEAVTMLDYRARASTSSVCGNRSEPLAAPRSGGACLAEKAIIPLYRRRWRGRHEPRRGLPQRPIKQNDRFSLTLLAANLSFLAEKAWI